jgi:hypothetical protein
MSMETQSKNRYEVARDVIREMMEKYDMTSSEAVDYIATEKTQTKPKDWSDVRDVGPSTVTRNVSGARRKVNNARLDVRVNEDDGRVTIYAEDRDGEQHELPFMKETTVAGYDEDATLKAVYEHASAIHGYYGTESGEQFESTLFFDGEPYNTFEEFDFFDEYSGEGERWRGKADVVLWERGG